MFHISGMPGMIVYTICLLALPDSSLSSLFSVSMCGPLHIVLLGTEYLRVHIARMLLKKL